MKLFKDYNQNKTFLLPPSLDEFVPEDHEARILSEAVDSLNLSSLLAKYEGGGAPVYHPAMMLKVLIYAYSQGIYSSRSIARQLQTNTAFMFLSGMQEPQAMAGKRGAGGASYKRMFSNGQKESTKEGEVK